MIFGGAIPYVFQYKKIYRQKSAAGFSLYICLALSTAYILRIMFWVIKRFEDVLLIQSVVMIATMVLMLEISVRMNRRRMKLQCTKWTSIWKCDFINAFWQWTDLSSYIATLLVFSALSGVATYFFMESVIFGETLGMISLLVEVCLGLPQLVRNFNRKSIEGMSIVMIFGWFIGDVAKTVYFVLWKVPMQFWICSALQITVDVLILSQVFIYKDDSTRLPQHTSLNSSVKSSSLQTSMISIPLTPKE